MDAIATSPVKLVQLAHWVAQWYTAAYWYVYIVWFLEANYFIQ